MGCVDQILRWWSSGLPSGFLGVMNMELNPLRRSRRKWGTRISAWKWTLLPPCMLLGRVPLMFCPMDYWCWCAYHLLQALLVDGYKPSQILRKTTMFETTSHFCLTNLRGEPVLCFHADHDWFGQVPTRCKWRYPHESSGCWVTHGWLNNECSMNLKNYDHTFYYHPWLSSNTIIHYYHPLTSTIINHCW